MQEYSPAVAELPTTNGDWAQGEGIQLGAALGAALLHMDQVQVHPTGFVDPADPAAGTKVGLSCHMYCIVCCVICIVLYIVLQGLLLHMDQVHVHPTGFVHPADPAAGTKVISVGS
jgi:hypothetical protein